MKINLINTQWLSQMKFMDIDNLLQSDDMSIMCLVETHMNTNNVKMANNVKFINKMRKIEDTKGGGLMIAWINDNFEIQETEHIHADIISAKTKFKTLEFHIILVYISTNNQGRNDILYKKIIFLLNKYHDRKIFIVGDFNGHIGILGSQKINKNGKRLIDLSDNHDLNILNLDTNCNGTTTWSQRDHESVIDFALVNEKMYRHFYEMTIDEKHDILSISDHNLLQIILHFDKPESNHNKNEIISISFNKKDDDAIENFLNYIDQATINEENEINMDKLNKIIRDAEQEFLKVTITKKKSNKNDAEPPWMNSQIKKEISKRRFINKLRRNEKNIEIFFYFRPRICTTKNKSTTNCE